MSGLSVRSPVPGDTVEVIDEEMIGLVAAGQGSCKAADGFLQVVIGKVSVFAAGRGDDEKGDIGTLNQRAVVLRGPQPLPGRRDHLLQPGFVYGGHASVHCGHHVRIDIQTKVSYPRYAKQVAVQIPSLPSPTTDRVVMPPTAAPLA